MGSVSGYSGVFAIKWSQTEIWGEPNPALECVEPGAQWSWHGRSVRLDGPDEVLQLTAPEGQAALRVRAAIIARRLAGSRAPAGDSAPASRDQPPQAPPGSLELTDGVRRYEATLAETARGRLLVFSPVPPPADAELWVTDSTLRTGPVFDSKGGDVICFTPGTMISTISGQCPVEELLPGDWVQTRDDGPQPVLWCGRSRISGARLFLDPGLRPVRLRASCMGMCRPTEDLLVSPGHRVLVTGRRAEDLFNTSEVLVAAGDLLDDYNITRDYALASVTYVHVMLERHQVIRANGLFTESFHPAHATAGLDPREWEQLSALVPEMSHGLADYGPEARRCLSQGEVAILRGDWRTWR